MKKLLTLLLTSILCLSSFADIDEWCGVPVDSATAFWGVSGIGSLYGTTVKPSDIRPSDWMDADVYASTYVIWRMSEEGGAGTNASGQVPDYSTRGTNYGIIWDTVTFAKSNGITYWSFDGTATNNILTETVFGDEIGTAVNITLEAMVYFANGDDNGGVAVQRDTSNRAVSYKMGVSRDSTSSGRWRADIAGVGTPVYVETANGVWKYVCLVLESGNIGRLYTDLTLRHTVGPSGSVSFSGTDFVLGPAQYGDPDLDTSYIPKDQAWAAFYQTNLSLAVQTNHRFHISYDVGLLSPFLYDNSDIWSNTVWAMSFNGGTVQDWGPQNWTTMALAAPSATPTYVGSSSNGWYSFDGGDHMRTPDLTVGQHGIDNLSNVTMCCWVYPDSGSVANNDGIMGCVDTAADSFGLVVGGASSGGTTNFYLEFDNDGDFGSAYIDRDEYTTAGTMLPDQWNHIGITLDGATTSIVFYINGVTSATAAVSGSQKYAPYTPSNIEDRSFAVGYLDNPAWGSFTGDIDEPLVINQTLTPAQMKELYNSRAVLMGRSVLP